MYNQILLTNVLRLLDELNMTKKELSEKSGVSISFLSELTNDKANPSLKVMESLAQALDTPLPVLLDSTDMDEKDLEQLSGGTYKRSLPVGYTLVCAYLNEYQAYTVKLWDTSNRKQLQELRKKNRKISDKVRF